MDLKEIFKRRKEEIEKVYQLMKEERIKQLENREEEEKEEVTPFYIV